MLEMTWIPCTMNHSQSSLKEKQQDMQLQHEKITTAALRSELTQTKERLDAMTKIKAEIAEKFAVCDAEYRTYKRFCESNDSGGKLHEELQSLLRIEADKATACSRVETAEVCLCLCTRLRGGIICVVGREDAVACDVRVY